MIFNRSHYEDVLVARVHNFVPRKTWSKRYDEINAFERTLVEGGTHILKFYLHISKKTQLTRIEERLDDPAKRWKISEADYSERKLWGDYTKAYEDVLSRCSKEDAPWFVIPSDHKWFRNLAIARIVVEHLESLRLKMPKPSVYLVRIRRQYRAARDSSRRQYPKTMLPVWFRSTQRNSICLVCLDLLLRSISFVALFSAPPSSPKLPRASRRRNAADARASLIEGFAAVARKRGLRRALLTVFRRRIRGRVSSMYTLALRGELHSETSLLESWHLSGTCAPRWSSTESSV